MEIYTGVNEQLKRLLAKAEELDWSYNVWIETERNNRTYVEMEKYSPAGEDFIMIIDFNAQNQAETFLKDLQDCAENFDIDDHVEMWMPERGKGGCPSTLKELMEDAKAILAMIKELIEELTGIKEQSNEEKLVEFVIKNFHHCPIPAEMVCEYGFGRDGCVGCLLSHIDLLKLPRED